MLNVVMNVGFCCCQNVFVCECLHSLNGVLTVGGRDIIRNVFKVKIRERVRTWILYNEFSFFPCWCKTKVNILMWTISVKGLNAANISTVDLLH